MANNHQSTKSKSTNKLLKKVQSSPQSRLDIIRDLSELTNLSRTKVAELFQLLHQLIGTHIKKKGSGKFIVPFCGIQVRLVKRKARKERVLISPLDNKEYTIPAKAAKTEVKLVALKPLKQLISS